MIKSRIQQLGKENIVAYVMDKDGHRGLTKSEYESFKNKRSHYKSMTIAEMRKKLEEIK